MSNRRPFLAGNWKMNTRRQSCEALLNALVHYVGHESTVDVAVCPPFVYLTLAHEILSGSRIALGAQNMYFEAGGAFTGEIAANMLGDVGCAYVILGHSERRHVLGEDDEVINRKIRAALEARLKPIFCVGELLAEREAGKTNDVVGVQIRNGLVGVRPEQMRDITVAYEPVWAIGTGKVATPEQAEEAYLFIRGMLTKLYGADISQSVRLQYGGSVKADNAEGLLSQPNIDGALVGGASLKAEDFTEIVRAGVRVAAAKT